MRYALVCLAAFIFIASSHPSYAQDSDPGARDEAAVRAVIDALFDGMRAGDSTAVRGVFAEKAILGRVATTGRSAVLETNDLDHFVTTVGTPHDQVYDERIWDVQILVDGPMAVAWVPYAFFLGDELSHCGVNAFQLYRAPAGWKVFHIVDTARQEGCDVPDDAR